MLDNLNKIAFIGFRINFLSFDPYEVKKKYIKKGQKVYPLTAELNMNTEELVICSKNEIKFLSLETGRIKRILTHLISPEEQDELTDFRLIQKNHKFMVSDHNGLVQIHSYSSGEKINQLESHGSAVS